MRATALGLLLICSLGVLAQPSQVRPGTPMLVSSPEWSSLTRAQQQALAPLQREWAALDAAHRAKWLEVAARFSSMAPAERDRIQARMTEWARMSPTERGRTRQQFLEAQRFPAEDRQARWESYSALPEEQRAALAQRGKPSPPRVTNGAPAQTTDPARQAAKRNLVPAATSAATATRPVTPTVVQVKPGATTTLLSQPAKPPVYQQPGLPKVAATEGFVDPQTLLPRRGPQAAAARPSKARAAAPAAAPSAAAAAPAPASPPASAP